MTADTQAMPGCIKELCEMLLEGIVRHSAQDRSRPTLRRGDSSPLPSPPVISCWGKMGTTIDTGLQSIVAQNRVRVPWGKDVLGKAEFSRRAPKNAILPRLSQHVLSTCRLAREPDPFLCTSHSLRASRKKHASPPAFIKRGVDSQP